MLDLRMVVICGQIEIRREPNDNGGQKRIHGSLLLLSLRAFGASMTAS
jgi:hypothetical protein